MQMLQRAKKSLGQNFLRDGNARRRIVAACGFSASDTVLEIGPGRGSLTSLIAERVKKVYAVELDQALAEGLQEQFRDNAAVDIRQGDILRFDPGSLPEARAGKITVIGNIPYYITSPILEHLIDNRQAVKAVFLTVQKEFARRICAAPGSKEYGSFSCYIQYYTKPAILFDIKKNSFYPVPKVDSSFIRLEMRAIPAVHVSDEERLFRVIRHAFQQRRKTLRKSLKGIVAESALERFFACSGIPSTTRPERLSLQDFAALAGSASR
jgi:16S rRNA (adenine1518-N6/adenine1519-N6)-dimethyltransferase